jgi:hypothetical protein
MFPPCSMPSFAMIYSLSWRLWEREWSSSTNSKPVGLPLRFSASVTCGHSAGRQNIFPVLFALLARLSKDSNMFRKLVTEG